MTLASSSIDSGTKALISLVSLLGPNKSNSTYEHVNTLKNCTINNLLENLKISNKYKKFDEDFNKKNKEKLIQNSWFQKLFEMKYTTLFNYYFNDNKPLNEMILFEKKIILTSNRFMI